MKYLYRVYQIFIAAPLLILATALTAIVTIVGCTWGNGHFWGYHPARLWSKFFCRALLLPIEVVGKENIDRNTSYVFVANHQGAMDIFLIYGYLPQAFRWMMKKSLEKIPLVGYACRKAHHIFVDQSSPRAIAASIVEARQTLQDGTSVVVFPEGTRSRTGHMGPFRRGAFLVADRLHLPIVPLTIDGAYEVLPRTHDIDFVHRHRLRLVIHAPIPPQEQGRNDIDFLSQKAREIIQQDLPEKYR